MFYFDELQKFEDCEALIHYQDVNLRISYKYKELIQEGKAVFELLQDFSDKNVIGIVFVETVFLFPIILGVLNSSQGFSCLSGHPSKNSLNRLQIEYFFSERDDFPLEEFQIVATISILKKTFYFIRLSTFIRTNVVNNNICYQISTSGSTGTSKTVQVPYSCIRPNIFGLQKIFQLTSKDIIFQVSPPTFDPFVVDLFLAFLSGASLLLVAQHLRFSKEMLSCLFGANGVSFLQTTPSLFQRWSEQAIKDLILHQNSSLGILVLGGESFPQPSVLKKWQEWPSNKRIFNIYGITEISCWATILEVNINHLELENIPIGQSFDDETILDFKALPEGGEELLIGSETRICGIDSEQQVSGPVFRSTGDHVKRLNNEIYCIGRTNCLVKKFGIRINLARIENTAKKLLLDTCCIFQNNKIILFYIANKFKKPDVLKMLVNKLKDFEVPDEIFELNEFPLSAHGKVSKKHLYEVHNEIQIKTQTVDAELYFMIEVKKLLPMFSNNAAKKQKLNLSFKALGGTSIEAMRITMSLESKINQTFPELLVILLDQSRNLEDARKYIREISSLKFVNRSNSAVSDSLELKILTKFDLQKCVDASVSNFHIKDINVISVGSHSGILLNINAESLDIISQIKLPDRIECKVTLLLPNYGIVGCYDGHLYCFDIFNGKIIWKFDSQGMIKSKPLVIENRVLFGNYNETGNFWCLDANGNLLWNQKLGEKGVLAAPLAIENERVFVASLDGTCSMLNLINGSILWITKLNTPTFANPQKIPGTNEIILAEVSNKVHCLNYLGQLRWTIETDGNIFSSFEFLIKENNNLLIIFGCHSKKIICLLYDYNKAKMCWEVELQSQIYTTPKLLRTEDQDLVVCCSTNGHLYLINLENRKIEGTLKLPGEIFSSPVVVQDSARKSSQIFVGCRDNFLYCLSFDN